VVHARDEDELAAGDAGRGRLVRLDQRREVGVADQQRRRHRDLAEPVEDGRVFLLEVAGGQDGPGRGSELLHRLGGGAGSAPDALDDARQGVDVAGGLGPLPFGPEHGALIRVVVERDPGDAGAEQHQGGHPLRLREREPEGGAAALAAADDRGPLEAVVVEHRHQVGQQRELRRRGGRPAEAAGVVPDHPVPLRQRGQHRVPDPRVADPRVQQRQRRPVAAAVVRPHRTAVHVDHRRRHTAHHRRRGGRCHAL
jgi:hypothetical protein